MRSVASTTVVNRVASILFIIKTKGSRANPGFETHSRIQEGSGRR